MLCSSRLSLSLVRLFFLAVVAIPVSTALAEDETRSKLSVEALIEQLGSESYATRLRAKESLQRIGLEAFDQLHLAQFHPDSEIAMSARFLLSSLLVSWSKESDPPEVRETLLEYGACSESERSSRIDRLAEFPKRRGLEALIRVSSFERSLKLSRRAALAIMQQQMSDDPAMRLKQSEKILEVLDDNDRQAAAWLRVYAADLASGKYSSERWRELIRGQRQEIDTASSQQTSRESVLELIRVCSARAAAAGSPEEAIAIATENIDLIPPTTRSLVDSCTWAIDNGLHPFVLELQRKHRRMFERQPVLLYGAAEAEHAAGNRDAANLLAEKASKINPLPTSVEAREKMQPKDLEETAKSHREIGNKLVERGLFQWAEREFRMIIDAVEINAFAGVGARTDLALMLSDLERHRDVVEVLTPLIERLEKDGKLKQQLIAVTYFSYSAVRSSAKYHEALMNIEDGNIDAARNKLVKAYQWNRDNVDILISMHQLDGDQEWRLLVKNLLQAAVLGAEREIDNERDKIRRFGDNDRIDLGLLLNNYAWLVANTEGDKEKALRFSIEAIELEPTGANLDTCARCHFANGDIVNAITLQKRAIKLIPHSPPLHRQLALFEKALKDQSNPDGADNEDAANSRE